MVLQSIADSLLDTLEGRHSYYCLQRNETAEKEVVDAAHIAEVAAMPVLELVELVDYDVANMHYKQLAELEHHIVLVGHKLAEVGRSYRAQELDTVGSYQFENMLAEHHRG